jgi:N-acetylglucosamine-6-sulfatase
MNRREFLNTTITSSASIYFSSIAGALLAGGKYTEKKPNIIFILSDDHANNAISAYGSKVNMTPNIDRIAKEGVIFTNSFCTNSICQPSRANILTGKHSHMNGVTYNGARWDGQQKIFPRLLKKSGYQTALIGKWHLVPNPTTEFDYWKVLKGFGGQGAYYNPTFDTQEGEEKVTGYSTDIIGNDAIDWLNNERDDSNPFLLMVQFKSPHVPRRPPLRYLNLFENVDIPEPSTLYDDHADREKYSSEAFVHVSDLNEEILGIFPPKDSNIALNKWQKKWCSRLTDEQMKKFHEAYDARNTEYYEMKKNGALDNHKARTKYGYKRYMQEYLACIQAVDDNVGKILDYLEDKNLANNTVIVYCSDQSYFTGEHGWYEKRWMYEESLMMPFMIRWPDVIKPGLEISEMVQNIDYMPTFLEIAGQKIPADVQGCSLMPFIVGNNKIQNWRQSIYYHYYEHGGHNVPRHDGVRTKEYKLIHYYTDNVYEMYDLDKDPDELKNVFNDPFYKDIKEAMIDELKKLRKKYEVPDNVFKAPYVKQL